MENIKFGRCFFHGKLPFICFSSRPTAATIRRVHGRNPDQTAYYVHALTKTDYLAQRSSSSIGIIIKNRNSFLVH